MTQQPDPIEIKVNVAGKVDDALAALGLDEGAPREVWFLDDLTDGARPPLPLLSNGIILRVRRRKKKEDSTVKLRPCRRSQLVSRWDARPAEDSDYRIEGTGRGNVMSLPRRASPTFNRAPFDRVLEDGGHVADLFGEPQRAFLSACGAIGVAFGGVGVLGPIASRQWKKFSVGGVDNVAAERWTAAGEDFLELSIRVMTGASDAAAQQSALETEVLARGLKFDDSKDPKTERIMKRLAGLD